MRTPARLSTAIDLPSRVRSRASSACSRSRTCTTSFADVDACALTKPSSERTSMGSEPGRGNDPEEVEDDARVREMKVEVPEADAIEQRQAAAPDDVDDEFDTVPLEVSEADALEQSRVVPVDDA